MVDEVETPENIYNSNALENSALTLKETEKILLEITLSRNVSVARVLQALRRQGDNLIAQCVCA